MTSTPGTSRTAGTTPPSCGAPARRSVLRAGGASALLLGATPLLAGCGDDGQASTGVSATDPDGTVRVPAADTPVGGSTYYADPKVVVSHVEEGSYVAFDAVCPHEGCATSDRRDDQLVCPCHNSRFDPATGDVLAGPAPTGLRVLSVEVDGEDLLVRG
ncbi:Rieske 2Fe-2S domain-containing protein [Ornithinimicrobium sp. W1665]|uniref:Rieske (2Fe-2S) protein n=1 Tax=Ornithinimicrobium sp. W1665 TaxID=3416666 RepID=UPI003CF834D6